MDDLAELIAMADMYASTCTRQEEKYKGFAGKHGYTWRWEDCIAAYDLIRALPDYWERVEAWRKEHKCRLCGFPKEAHAYGCSAR